MATDGPAVSLKEMLPMVSYGPNVTPEICCRKLRMPIGAAKKILPMVVDGPTVSQKVMLPIVSYGPKVVPETRCRKL